MKNRIDQTNCRMQEAIAAEKLRKHMKHLNHLAVNGGYSVFTFQDMLEITNIDQENARGLVDRAFSMSDKQ